ncbi:hypothetical protein [Kribbella sp. NPDC051620]|uniref:hypothetical protein n=1 Tax=Kribbella sp. NPDC051620 TaxID=3364120 RepID=UPI003795FA5A
MKVVLLSTRRLPPTYFDTVRADLGSPENLDLDVVAWVPPSGPVDGLVKSFTLVGPGRMPVAVVPPAEPVEAPADADEIPVAVSESAKAPAPEAVVDENAVESTDTEADEVAQATEAAESSAEGGEPGAGGAGTGSASRADEVAEGDESGGSTDGAAASTTSSSPAEVAAGDEAAQAQAEAINEPKPAPAAPKPVAKPRPTGAKRVVKAAQWRARKLRRAGGRMLPSAIKKSGPVKKLTQNRKADNLAKTYWSRVNTRADVMKTIEQADVIIALDGGSVWAGWQIGQVRTETPVVLGLPAARRELDRLVGAGQE